MEKGLTLSVVLMILLIYIPGHVVLSVAGRKKEERKINSALQYGMLVFACALAFVMVWEAIVGVNIFSGIIPVLWGLREYSWGSVDIWSVIKFFVVVYLLSTILGMIELLSTIGLPWQRKGRVRISANDPIKGVFLSYRREGKKPYIKAALTDGRKIEGECVKYGWNGEESILLRDSNGGLIWVPLREIHLIRFENLVVTSESQREKEKNRRILNRIADGLGDEVYR